MKHKKLLVGVAVVAVVLVVAAIGNHWDSQKPAPAASDPAPVTSDPAPAENPLIVADFKTADVMNGLNTEKIGEYGYTEIQKADMETVTAEQLTEFCKSKVADSGLNFVNIAFEDGTGLHVNVDSWFISIPYGTIDAQTAQLSETTGSIMPSAYAADGTTPASYEYFADGETK